jgi:hypothetical protein
MVVLALTRDGFEELRLRMGGVSNPMWVGEGVLYDFEIEKLRAGGGDLSVLSYRIDPSDSAAIEGAIQTIAEHHPGHRIWVERAA